MLFNSLLFFVSFILVMAVYYLIVSKRYQYIWLLVTSFAYYSYWNISFTIWLLISIVTTYMGALYIEEVQDQRRKFVLWSIVVINIAFLGYFKYSQFLTDTYTYFLASDRIVLELLIPVGISFYTFKVVSYISDVYYKRIDAETNICKYALYVSFFPQIVAGPIERAGNFLPQLNRGKGFDYALVKEGFILFLCGLLKKIVFADRLAILTDTVFNNVTNYGAADYVVAILAFTMQIYFDFSGYSDMAIGCGKMLGISTIKNFDKPYLATSIADFWHRWHISLSTWFKDYVYIPLGGNRVSQPKWCLNIMIVFLLSGLWHGANWTFIVWGGLHGVYQLIGKFTKNIQACVAARLKIHDVLEKGINSIVTFVLVAYAWMFFRANTISDSILITKKIILWDEGIFDIYKLGLGKEDIIFSVVILVIWLCIELLQTRINIYEKIQEKPMLVRWCVYWILMFTCIMFGIYGDITNASFVYFKF